MQRAAFYSRRLLIALAVFAFACTPRADRAYVDLATTTSVQNSGLLDHLLPTFTEDSSLQVRVHAAGSGRSLEMLRDQIVDVAITHAPRAEARYLAEHADWSRAAFAFNWFVIVGPPADPAKLRETTDVAAAFRRIAESETKFVSRGDESGTHERELELWDASGTRPPADRLIISGRGMALALRHADELQAYTLSDEATFRQLEPTIDLAIVFSGDERLKNVYSVVHPRGNERASRFAEWLTSARGRERVAAYRAGGRQVFEVVK